jgi:transcriptional regulator with XRE-family HTH domain
MRMARAGLGWSLVDLAQKAEINPNTISRYESGRDVLASKLRRLEEALIAAGVKFSEEDECLSVSVPIAPPSSAKGP